MLIQRIATAVLLASTLLAVLLFLPSSFVWLVLALMVPCSWEWARLCGVHRPLWLLIYVLFNALVLLSFFNWTTIITGTAGLLLQQDLRLTLAIASVFWLFASFYFIHFRYFREPNKPLTVTDSIRPHWLLLGTLVLLSCCLGLLKLQELGTAWVLIALSVAISTDIGSFVAGTLWGKHSLLHQISPNKTLEGAAGGLGVCLLLVLLVWQLPLVDLSFWQALLLISCSSIAAITGDLWESLMKRHLGVKDSGSLLPGHGGLLDRTDGILAVIPVFTTLLLLQSTR